MLRIGSIAAGMGMHLHGLKQLGGYPLWAIECDQEIAHCYRMNHEGRLYVKRVEDVDAQELEDIDLLTITLSCKNASVSKGTNRGETEDDVRAAIATTEIIKAKLPRFLILENVWQYRNFESFKLIYQSLAALGYYFQFYKFNCADFGVAQSRDRLYGLAVRHGAFTTPYAPNLPKKGWYEAIADLIPELPITELTNWQRSKFPVLPRIALLKRAGGGRTSDRLYLPHEPSFTIRALGRNSGHHSRSIDAVVGERIVAVTPRACLRLFGDKETADKIILPTTKSLAMEVVGNGASWDMFKFLFNHLCSGNHQPVSLPTGGSSILV